MNREELRSYIEGLKGSNFFKLSGESAAARDY